MVLKGTVACVFAAGGAIGSAVARRLAQDGATVYLSGRRLDPVRAVAAAIEHHGGQVHVAEVDATDPAAIESYLDDVADRSGGVDVVFNAIGVRADEGRYNSVTADVPVDAFLLPMRVIAGSQYATARWAARHMGARGRGLILTLSASLARAYPAHMAGITAACAAVEAMTLCLAAELGPAGVRVACLRPDGMPETRTIQETFARAMDRDRAAGGAGDDQLPVPLMPTLADTAAMAAFLASDAASAITGIVEVRGGVRR